MQKKNATEVTFSFDYAAFVNLIFAAKPVGAIVISTLYVPASLATMLPYLSYILYNKRMVIHLLIDIYTNGGCLKLY